MFDITSEERKNTQMCNRIERKYQKKKNWHWR